MSLSSTFCTANSLVHVRWDGRKIQFYRTVEDISRRCQPVGSADLNDTKVAEATAEAAMRMILQRNADVKDQRGDFLTDAYATVAIAYRRAAGVYSSDEKMQELGTAAVHLLTMATSYTDAQKE